jgi:hypothetical protein
MRLVFALLAVAFLAPGQDRDFLTADEADQVREAQEPNLRLKLYLKFAQDRVELLKQLLAAEKPGRTVLIHDTLEDYTHIIEAIDTVADDALKRKLNIAEGMKLTADAEKEMLAELRKLNEKPAKDSARYEFAMQQALETTQDSTELSAADLTQRAGAVAEREKRDKAGREAMTATKDVQQKKAEEKKADETKRKIPTLRRKGEEVKQP